MTASRKAISGGRGDTKIIPNENGLIQITEADAASWGRHLGKFSQDSGAKRLDEGDTYSVRHYMEGKIMET